jgi:hypothetical protein
VRSLLWSRIPRLFGVAPRISHATARPADRSGSRGLRLLRELKARTKALRMAMAGPDSFRMAIQLSGLGGFGLGIGCWFLAAEILNSESRNQRLPAEAPKSCAAVEDTCAVVQEACGLVKGTRVGVQSTCADVQGIRAAVQSPVRVAASVSLSFGTTAGVTNIAGTTSGVQKRCSEPGVSLVPRSTPGYWLTSLRMRNRDKLRQQPKGSLSYTTRW